MSRAWLLILILTTAKEQPTYRDIRPEFFTTSLWDSLLITRDWRIRLIDHKASFSTARELGIPKA